MLPVRVKYAGEARRVTFDFTSKLAPGDTLVGTATVTADPGLTVGAPASDLVQGVVTALVSGGTADQDYLVTCSHASSERGVWPAGTTLVKRLRIAVRADAN